jgi:hypothetical protein
MRGTKNQKRKFSQKMISQQFLWPDIYGIIAVTCNQVRVHVRWRYLKSNAVMCGGFGGAAHRKSRPEQLAVAMHDNFVS